MLGYKSGDNLIVNGGFEVAGGGGADVFGTWLETAGAGAIQRDTSVFRSGVASCKIISNNTFFDCYIRTPDIVVVPNTMYMITNNLRGDGSNGVCYGLYDQTHSAWIRNYQRCYRISTDFVRRDILFYAPSGCSAIRLFYFIDNVVGSTAFLDDLTMHKWNSPQKFYDSFQRADGDPDRSPGGFAYDLQPDNLSISNNRLVFPAKPTVGYGRAYVDLPAIPKRMSMRFKWDDDGVDIGDVVCMTSSNDRFKFQSYKHMLHFYILTNEWVFQYVDDAGAFQGLGSGELALVPGIDYESIMEISGNTVILHIPTIAPQIITDVNVGVCAGQYVYYELGRTVNDRKSPSFSFIDAIY